MGHIARWTGVASLSLLALAGCNEAPRCGICSMPIPPETHAIAIIDDDAPRHVCDARCPLTLEEETGRRVRLLEVTDFPSGAVLEPGRAWFVSGSDTAPDAHTDAIRTGPTDAAYLHWHRCLPSLLAFASEDAAQSFRREHGGDIVRYADLGFSDSATAGR